MKYFVIFLVLASFTVFMPHAFGSCVSLPCDDANIKLEEPNYRFIDFSYQNKVGEPITFVLEKTAYDQCNSYVATITNEKNETIWAQTKASFCVIVESNQNLITSQIKLGYDPDNKIIVSESAKYLLKVQIDGGSIEREFVVRQNHSGGSLDRTVYPVPWETTSPLKQINSGISFDKIECKENLVLVQKYDGSPACVTEQTRQKLIERGWAEKNTQLQKIITTPYCKDPLYILDVNTNTCITNESLPKCTDSTTDDTTIQHCRVSVTCDKEYDYSTMKTNASLIPQCEPFRKCPDGFLFAIFPVNGGDALCEREERNIYSGIYHPNDQMVLSSSDMNNKEKTDAKPVNLNGSEEQRTIQIIVLMSGWYEKLGTPMVIIESNGERIEQIALDLKKNEPGQVIHGMDYVLSNDLPDGTVTLTFDMPGYDSLPPQSFSVEHITK